MPTRTRNAYQHLQGQIASGSLAPGDLISESALAKELGCSRTPVGEALRLLADDGLVKQVPRYGTIVREILPEELIELFEVREALEVFAARKAAERVSTRTLEDLRGLCGRIDQEIELATAQDALQLEGDALRRFLAADMAFHMLIIAAAGNRRLIKVAQQTKSVAHVFQSRRGRHTLQRVQQANDEHKGILDALESRDPVATCTLLGEHIRASCKMSIDGVENSGQSASLSGLDLPNFLKNDLFVE